MDKAIMCSCNNDPSAQRQHRNLQTKAHSSDFISPGGAFQHFLSASCSRTPPCSLEEDLSSRLPARPSGSAPCPAAQHTHWLSTGCDLHTQPQEFGQSTASVRSAWAGPHWRAQAAPGTATQAQPAWSAFWRHNKGCSAHSSPACPWILSFHLYPHGKVRSLQIMAALSAQPGSCSRKVEMPPLNIKTWVLLKDILLILWILCPLKLQYEGREML